MIRAFLAIDLSQEIRGRYESVSAAMRARMSRVRWVRPENLHLTLRFLGDVAESRLDPLRSEVETVTCRTAPFRAELGAAGGFGPRGAPSVLWFALEDGSAALARLVAELERPLASLGWAPEPRPWTAHLTVARNPRRIPWSEWEAELESWGLAGMGFDVREAVLYSSTLRPRGPTYSAVWSLPLRGGSGESTA